MPRQRTNHSRRVYVLPDDFPQRLVRFQQKSELPRAEMHRRLGVDPETLRRWRDKGASSQNAAIHRGELNTGYKNGEAEPRSISNRHNAKTAPM